MEKKKNVSPSVDEAKLRIELYNELSAKLSDLSLEETRIVLEEMEKYVKLIVSNVNMAWCTPNALILCLTTSTRLGS